MPTTAGPRCIRTLAEVAMTPLTWLERARGRWRLALATLYLLILAVAASLTWRAFSLWNLPDIGEPFDVAAFTTCDVPDDQNAFVLYAKAAAMLRPLRDASGKVVADQDVAYNMRWALAGPRARAWHELNRPALETWYQGTKRDRAWPRVGPDRPDMERRREIEFLHVFTLMALVEAGRLRDAGDFAGTWDWYRAALRCSRHATARGFDTSLSSWLWEWRVAPDVRDWAKLPAVDRPLLRRALDDVRAADALVADDADAIKNYYLSMVKDLERSRTDWLDLRRAAEANPYRTLLHEPELRWFLMREPDRTRRLIRIAVANWLAHRALDPTTGPDLSYGPLSLWPLGPDAPAVARALPFEEAGTWLESSLVLKTLPGTRAYGLDNELNADRRARAGLILDLARRLYELDHGKPPAADVDLVGPYLDRLPAGFVAPLPPADEP